MKTEIYNGEQRCGEIFYILSKSLFTEPELKKLSAEAKLLYALLYDRVARYGVNGMKDKNGMTYIYFTVAEAADFLNCSPDKAIRVFKELEAVNQTGLIERKSQGHGKPAIVYIKKIIPSENKNPQIKNSENKHTTYRKNRILESSKYESNNNNINNNKNNNIYKNFSLSQSDIDEYLLFCERNTGL